MSSTTGTATATTSSNVTYGTDVAPISFPGIASGIDYTSIINKYVDLTMAQATPLKTKVTALNSQQTELLKIQDLLSKFQDTFAAISDPNNFNATKATSSNSSVLAATSITGSTAAPGSYTIQQATLATSTSIVNSAAANGTFSETTALASAGTSVTPSNGVASDGTQNSNGQITIDGVAISYDVNGNTLDSIMNAVNSNATLTADGVQMTYDAATQKVTLTSTGTPLTIGSGSDTGNLATVLKLDTSPITTSVNGGGQTVYSVSSSSGIGGINDGATLNTDNNAGFATAVTSGVFSINGVKFTVDASANNLSDLITQINQSSAGVVASYDEASGSITLTSKSSGPQGVVLGSAADTSNFLQAAGFLTSATTPGALAAGASETVGQAAEIQYTDASGLNKIAYSNSNTITNVIPGVSLNLTQAIDGTVVQPVTVTVGSDTSALQSAIGSWVTAYNAVIKEINTATAAPTIGSTTDSTTGQQVSGQIGGGGILFNNQDVLMLRDQLISVVSGMTATGSSAYNSLGSIGLSLSSQFSVADAKASDTNASDAVDVGSTTYDGTDGTLETLDATTFADALSANPNAVLQLFIGSDSIATQVGAVLTNATGLPTQLDSGTAGSIPSQSLLNVIEQGNTDQISSLNQQIQLVTDQANFQANRLRTEFSASEGMIAQLQAEQQSIAALGSSSG